MLAIPLSAQPGVHLLWENRAFLLHAGASHRKFLQFLSSFQVCTAADTEKGVYAFGTGRSLAALFPQGRNSSVLGARACKTCT